jgi:regulator of protease activity HflC (stomatin/prohibitin superfamily)
MEGFSPLLQIVSGIAITVAVIWFALQWSTITVFEFQRAVKYIKGTAVGIVGAGRYRYWSPTTSFNVVDMRPDTATVGGQEVLTADNVSLRTSISATYRVIDVAKALGMAVTYQVWIYDALQTALREVTSTATIDDLLVKRAELGQAVQEKAAPALVGFGIELQSVAIKDVMFPGEFRKAFSQVVVARQEGLAALERARGETAALRHLANAAKMMDDNPNLLQLRALQAVEKGGGTLVLGGADGLAAKPRSKIDQPN